MAEDESQRRAAFAFKWETAGWRGSKQKTPALPAEAAIYAWTLYVQSTLEEFKIITSKR